MKPMIIVPPDLIDPENIKALRDNDICVVVAKDPSKVRFVDPIPAVSQRGKIEDSAIRFSRIVLNKAWSNYTNNESLTRREMTHIFVDCLIEGTPLDKNGGPEEEEKRIKQQARWDELDKIARQEARAERAKKNAAQTARNSTPVTK